MEFKNHDESKKENRELINSKTSPAYSEYLDTKEAASFLKVSISTIQKISASRIIPLYKPSNGKVYFLKQDLISYIEAGRKKSYFELQAELNKFFSKN